MTRTIPRWFFQLFDSLIVTAAFLTAYLSRPHIQSLVDRLPHGGGLGRVAEILSVFPGTPVVRPLGEVYWILLVMVPVTLLVLYLQGGYGSLTDQSRTRVALSGLMAPWAGLSLIALILFALKSPHWSRLLIFSTTVMGGVGLSLCRLALRSYRRRRLAAGFHARNVVLVGGSRAVAWMKQYFEGNIPRTEYRAIGYFSVPGSGGAEVLPGRDTATGGPYAEWSCLGAVGDLGQILISTPIHEVIVIQPSGGSDWLKKVVDDCDYFGITVRIVPEPLLYENLRDLRFAYRGDPFNLPEIVLKPRGLESDALFVKRVFDIVVGLLLLLLTAPLLLLIALAIKLTTPSLPVLYRWRVVGYKGKPFTSYKFTTMVADADQRKDALRSRNEMNGPVFKMKDDPRATPLGQFLRRYSLNELPQIWSVVRGDMSLVGPRPAFPHELERYELWHKRKLSVRPGITCLWQTRGRNRINNFDDWVRMDLEYIDNWSLWLDLKILIRTAWVVVAGTGS